MILNQIHAVFENEEISFTINETFKIVIDESVTDKVYSPFISFDLPRLACYFTCYKKTTEQGIQECKEYLLTQINEHITNLENKLKVAKNVHNKVNNYTINKKHFYIMPNVGKVKFLLNIHDGIKTHDDGSPFYDIKSFKSSKKLTEFTDNLFKKGYVCT
jgi:hypothetical protein